jgi:hypothetical protein
MAIGMRRRSATRVRVVVGAAAVAAAVGGAVVVARRRGAGTPTAERVPATPSASAEQRYACDCGAMYTISGAGRHRVIWPADGTAADAVLEDNCPACGRPWPAEDAPASAQPA